MHPSVMFFIRLHSSLLEGLVWRLLETNGNATRSIGNDCIRRVAAASGRRIITTTTQSHLHENGIGKRRVSTTERVVNSVVTTTQRSCFKKAKEEEQIRFATPAWTGDLSRSRFAQRQRQENGQKRF
jgi:hypothetical protein